MNHQSFKEVCSEIYSGKFESCCLQTITKHILETSAICFHEVRGRVALVVKAKFKPSMAADTWSDSTISLMASMLYCIDDVLLNCTGFTGERHTGEAIRNKTFEDSERA